MTRARFFNTLLLAPLLATIVAGCATATVTTPRDRSTAPESMPTIRVPQDMDAYVNVLDFNEAVRKFGSPLEIEGGELLDVTWDLLGRDGSRCQLSLSFSSVTSRLLTWRSGCP